jgi:hypothetical protein
MPRSLRLISNSPFITSNVCVSCQWRLSRTGSQPHLVRQKRWISQNHIKRIKEALEDWQLRAAAIRRGEKQSMLSLLDERGYVNQIVGFVHAAPGIQRGCIDLSTVKGKILTICLRNEESVPTLGLILLLRRCMLAIWYPSWHLGGFTFTDTQLRFW